MYLNRPHRTFSKLKNVLVRHTSQVALLDQHEYTETPEYPPISDMSLAARKRRLRETTHEKIRKLNTVEEKQIALNMPKFYGWPCVMLNEDKAPYNAMPMIQSYTRSHFISVEKLPDSYADTATAAEEITKEVKSFIEDAIGIEAEGIEHTFDASRETEKSDQIVNKANEICQKENAFAKILVKQINRIITNNLSDKVPHILSSQVDYDPIHEAFWFVGGVDLHLGVVKYRQKNKHIYKDFMDENVDRPVQYIGSPLLTLRNQKPLKPILPYSEAENPEFKVAKFTAVPQSVGFCGQFRHGTNIPGFWPGDYDEFGLLSYHGRGYMLTRNKSFGPEDDLEALHCQAIKSSFGWLLAQANYQGFTTYNDLTYPLVTQTVITNGQFWSFYAYQLNTVVMHNEHIDENPKHNVCFGTKPMKLYESIENGKVKGLNEDVLNILVQFYLNTPEEREHEMKPYLGTNEQVVADIEDDNKRIWLENRYKHLVSNRPKHFLLPETYLWENIYKIQHNTRFHEAKRRPFELGIDPYRRRLDEHLPPYIPKALRPYPRHKKKFESTYYPDV